MRCPRALTLTALLAALVATAFADDRAAVDELLRSARLWQSLDRPVNQRYALQKVLAVDADEPRALLLLGELELKAGRPAEAQKQLTRLQRTGAPAFAAELQVLMRLYGPERARLNQLRLLRRGGNDVPALALAQQLFPDGRPPGEFAAEFVPLLAKAPGGWERSRAWLEERAARGMDSPREQLALYQLLAERPETRAQGLRGLDELSSQGELPAETLAAARRAVGAPPVAVSRVPAPAPVIAAAPSSSTASAPARALAGTVAQAPAPSASRSRTPDRGRAAAPPVASTAAPRPPTATATQSDGERYWSLLREAESLRDAGRIDDALQRVTAAQVLQPREPEGALLRADLELLRGDSAAAEAIYRGLLADPSAQARAARRLLALLQSAGRLEDALAVATELPEPPRADAVSAIDGGAVRDAADRQIAADRPGVALRLLESGAALRPTDPWMRYDLARLYARLGQPALGRTVFDEGLAAAPADRDMRYAAALYLASIDDDAAALALVEPIPAAERSDGERALVERVLASQARAAARAAGSGSEAVASRPATTEAGLFRSWRNSDPGRSTLASLEMPIVVTRPLAGAAGSLWLHVDPVHVDAKALPAAFAEASQFGKVFALGNGQALPADVPQRDNGLSLGVGYTGDDRRWDIGIAGAGFRLPNVVGGWREGFSVGGADVSVDISRRAMASSLLAYAGVADPITGERWGGVTQNAIGLRVGHYASEGWSASASLRGGLMEGHHVADNTFVQLRLAADRDWLRRPDFTVNAGLALAHWRYRDNLGFYTFGQGGYYSPQRYTSIALPVELTGREGPWAYRVRGAFSYSKTFEADTPYYPTDAALQAAAGNPMHSGGGNGGGPAASLRADLERRLNAHWSTGASLIVDRSSYYAPTQVLFYLRRSDTPQTGEVPLPRPVQPYSQF